MATGARFLKDATTETSKDVSEWSRPGSDKGPQYRKHGHDQLNTWSTLPVLSDDRLDVLKQREHVQSIFRAQQKAAALPNNEWLLNTLNTLVSQLQSQQQWLKLQQQEIDALKRRIRPHSATQEAPRLDVFQRWMSENRKEVAKYRGKHIAIHAETGIVASAHSYSNLVNELERRKIADDQVVIEFISPAISTK